MQYGVHQTNMLLQVDPSGHYAYVFADTFVYSFDIVNKKADQTVLNGYLLLGPQLIPNSIDITDSVGILVGYRVQTIYTILYRFVAILINLRPIGLIQTIDLNGTDTQVLDSSILSNRANDMSVSLSPTRELAIIGVPMFDQVFLFSLQPDGIAQDGWIPNLIRIDTLPQRNVAFGRSVAWIDESTVAIVAFNIAERPWSISEVWVFAVDAPFTIPLFIFPNNQQTVTMLSSPVFIRILAWSTNLYLQTEQERTILVKSSAPGYISAEDDRSNGISVHVEEPCVPGTYRNVSSIGPCIVCPPQTKNPGGKPSIECRPCLASSFCPMGSVDDNASLAAYPSYTQTFSYPDSPDIDNYDDVLIHNIFTIAHSTRCLLIMPLFWTVLVIILCFFIWLIMTLMKLKSCAPGKHRRKQAKIFFKHTDIINEGEHWISGLVSFAIFLLFAFTIWFASEYIQAYPIETSSDMRASCDNTLRNAAIR